MLPTTVWIPRVPRDPDLHHGDPAADDGAGIVGGPGCPGGHVINPGPRAMPTNSGAATPPQSALVTSASCGSRSPGGPAQAGTALDLWTELLSSYLATRAQGTSATGELYPETSAGDVRRAALRFSRQLCLPRYDQAALGATRAAWRDADARIVELCRATPWHEPYPENERFWLSDALALAQRLAAIDTRRNKLAETPGGLLYPLGDRSDPLTTWQDVRAYFLARRPIKSDRGWRYPETTVGDVVQIVRIFIEDVARTVAIAPPGSDAARAISGRLEPWWDVGRRVHEAARLYPATAVYAENAQFWRVARALAVGMSVAADVAREDAARRTIGVGR